jgi:Zn-dependent protease/predicted transcriptional regulator
MHSGALRIVTWRGIEVRAHWSLAAIAALLTWSLAGTAFPANSDGYSTTAYWIAGVLASAALLVTIVGHEMGHSIVAQRRGIHVRRITMWLFGGVAELERRPQTWRDEMAVALAGPVVSFAVGVVSVVAAAIVWTTTGSGLATAALAWLGSTNVMLALFNMLPGAPLDGGRVFAAWRWRHHGSPVRARGEAARAGVTLAHGLVAVGVALLFFGATASGLWLAFLGWFLARAARAEFDDVEARHALDRLTVGEVMTQHPAMVPETMLLDVLVGCVLPKIHGSTIPVVRDGTLTGLITPDHLRRVAPGEWRLRTTGDIATPSDSIATATPDELLLDAFDRIDGDERRIVVVDDAGHVVGLITPTDLAHTIRVARLREAIHV